MPHLVEQVSTVLENHPHLPKGALRFDADSGRVTLRGTVRSWYQKQMAQETLKSVRGVDQIENQLVVEWR